MAPYQETTDMQNRLSAAGYCLVVSTLPEGTMPFTLYSKVSKTCHSQAPLGGRSSTLTLGLWEAILGHGFALQHSQVGCTYARPLGISALHVLQLWTGSGFQGSKLDAKEQHEVMQAALEEQKWYASLRVPLNNMCYFKGFLSRHGVWVQRKCQCDRK